jgi:hypothetical protein
LTVCAGAGDRCRELGVTDAPAPWPETVASEIRKIRSRLAEIDHQLRQCNNYEPRGRHAGLQLPHGTATLLPASIHGDRVGFEAAHSHLGCFATITRPVCGNIGTFSAAELVLPGVSPSYSVLPIDDLVEKPSSSSWTKRDGLRKSTCRSPVIECGSRNRDNCSDPPLVEHFLEATGSFDMHASNRKFSTRSEASSIVPVWLWDHHVTSSHTVRIGNCKSWFKSCGCTERRLNSLIR